MSRLLGGNKAPVPCTAPSPTWAVDIRGHQQHFEALLLQEQRQLARRGRLARALQVHCSGGFQGHNPCSWSG